LPVGALESDSLGRCGSLEAVVPWRPRPPGGCGPGGCGPLEAVVLEAAVPWRLWSPGGCGPGGCGPLEAVVPWRLWSWRLRSPGGCGPLEAVALEAVVLEATALEATVLEAAVPWRLRSPGGCGPLEAVVLEAAVPWRLWSPGGCGPLEATVLEAVVLEAVVPWRLWSPGGCGPLEATVLEAVVLEAVVLEAVVLEAVVLEATVLEAVVLEAVVLEAVVLEAAVPWRPWSWRPWSWRLWSWRPWSWRLWSWRLRSWRPWSWRPRSPGGCGPGGYGPGGCGPGGWVLEAGLGRVWELECENDYLYTINCSLRAPPPGLRPPNGSSWLNFISYDESEMRPGRCPLTHKENRSSCLCQNCTEETFGETPLKIYLCHEPCPTAACCEVLEENYYPQMNITPIAPSQPAVVTKSSRFIFSWSSSYEGYLPNFFLQDYLQYQLRLQREDQHQAPVTLSGMGRSLAVDVESLAAGGQYTARVRSSPAEGRGPLEAVVLEAAVPWRLWSPGGCGPGGCGPLEAVVPWRLWSWRLRSPGGRGPLEAVVLEAAVPWRLWSPGGCGPLEAVVPWRLWSPGGRGPGGCGPGGYGPGGCGPGGWVLEAVVLEATALEAVVPWRLWSPGGCGPLEAVALEAVVLEATALEAVVPWRPRSPGGRGPLEAVVLEAVVLEAGSWRLWSWRLRPWRPWSPGGCGPLEAVVPWRLRSWRPRSPGGCGPGGRGPGGWVLEAVVLEATALEAVVPWRLWSPGGCGPLEAAVLEATVLEATVLEAVVLEAAVPWRPWSPGGRGPLEAVVPWRLRSWRLWSWRLWSWRPRSPGGCGPLEAVVPWRLWSPGGRGPGGCGPGGYGPGGCGPGGWVLEAGLGLRPPNGSSWLNFISYDESEMRPGRCPLTHKENRSSCLCQNCTEETFGETPLKIYLCHEPCPTAACCEVLEENYYPQMNITPIAPSQPAVVTKSSRFIFSWSSSYEGYLPNFFLQDYLQYQLRLQREDQHQAPVTLSGMGRSLAVDVESLAAGGQYTARVRSSPAEGTDYRGKWSPWSQESRWWTPGGPPRGPPHRGRVWELECENDYLYTINCSLRAPPPGLRPPNGSSWLNFISYDESEMRPGRCPLTHKENRSSCLCQNCTEQTLGKPLSRSTSATSPVHSGVFRFIFSWKSSYEGYLPNFFLQDYLQSQLRLQREDQHQAPVTLSGMGRSLAVDVERSG
ncbi:unnamed protein product, partial [Gadus morhua 'NCC']